VLLVVSLNKDNEKEEKGIPFECLLMAD